jgi:hypothetical protein
MILAEARSTTQDEPLERESQPSEASLVAPSTHLGAGWMARLSPSDGGAVVRVQRGPGEPMLEIAIGLGAEGPVVRVRAAALEIESTGDLVARCDRFRVEARQSVELVSGGALRAEGRTVEVQATHGRALVQANDDVKLLGENVLLNCERSPTVPNWAVRAQLPPSPSVPVEQASGDPELVRLAMLARERPCDS